MLDPGSIQIVDFGVHISVPTFYIESIKPTHPDSGLSLFEHTGVSSVELGSTQKLFVKNVTSLPIVVPAGAHLAKLMINQQTPVDNQDLLGKQSPYLELKQEDISVLNYFANRYVPSELKSAQLNTTIVLPEDLESKRLVLESVAHLDKLQYSNISQDLVSPLSDLQCNKETVLQNLTDSLVLNSTRIKEQESGTPSKKSILDKSEALRQQFHTEMCQKLAVLGVDLMKNQSITREIFARSQQSDDYFSSIYQSIQDNSKEFGFFEIKNSVLYKKVLDKQLGITKYVICVPDVLLPSVIHTLHLTLGHPSVTATIKNFQAYYYNRRAARNIREYVKACITCSFAGKYDLKKVKPSTQRSLRPSRPRQYMYCDLIPMPKGHFTYILFCLDAYSQFVYAIPLRDKTASAVLHGFLSLFASVGWYEALYLDNEASFQKAAKLLLKIAPMSIHYSVPYCHFQNNAENYIKSFKRNFLKVLNDTENPQDNKDWALLLPTVTQSLNRQVIQSIGVSRDTLHFNAPTQFYPLAEISAADNSEQNSLFDCTEPNIYDTVKSIRERQVRKSNKAKVPEYFENQLVFVLDQTPSQQGVSSVLKIPTKGPFRIEKIDSRNVTLVDVETGKIFHSHLELLRPLSLKEFKLILSKKWDLNSHFVKSAQSVQTRSSFDKPLLEMEKEDVLRSEEDSLNLETLFESDSVSKPPDPLSEQNSAQQHFLLPLGQELATQSQTERSNDRQANDQIDPSMNLIRQESQASFNSFKVSEDISKAYKEQLLKRDPENEHSPLPLPTNTPKKSVSFAFSVIETILKELI